MMLPIYAEGGGSIFRLLFYKSGQQIFCGREREKEGERELLCPFL
jgi:hypothetical protein